MRTETFEGLDSIPDSEREQAEEARRLSKLADAARDQWPGEHTPVSSAEEDHHKRTGWRYLGVGVYQRDTGDE